jgi:gluconolactonase
MDHPEGVAQGPDGRVYAGGEAGQIYRISLEGKVEELASTGGFIYGVTTDGDGNVFACDFGNAALERISSAGEVSTFSTGTADHPLRVPNYAAFDARGNLYVTDSGGWGSDDGLIYRVSSSGETEVWTEQAPRFPNGCCIGLDGDTLLVIESRGRAISRIPIREDGSAGPIEAIVDLTGSQPDGIALASDGTMVVGCYRPDRLYLIDPRGTVDVLAEDPDGVILNQPANVAFVGPGLDRIVVSSLGGWSLMVADIGLVGAPLHHPRLG